VAPARRTTEEYADLLERSGFRLRRTISLRPSAKTMAPYLIEAEPHPALS
jgi:hypothetical protein